jgi:hypothetical protein
MHAQAAHRHICRNAHWGKATWKSRPSAWAAWEAAIQLTPDDLREIEAAASKVNVQEARYPENLERMTERSFIAVALHLQ